jgi:hypothetical protein
MYYMTDKHGVEVKIGDKVIGIDMSYNPNYILEKSRICLIILMID